jgi:uncharacterized protein YneF (UPF0154 family)
MYYDLIRHGIIFVVIFILFSVIAFLFINKKVNIRKNPEIVDEANRRLIAKGKPAVTAEDFKIAHRKNRILRSILEGFTAASLATLVNVIFGFIGLF